MILCPYSIRGDRTPPIWLLAVTDLLGRTWHRSAGATSTSTEPVADRWEHVSPDGDQLVSTWQELIAAQKALTDGAATRLTGEHDGHGTIVLSVADEPAAANTIAVTLSNRAFEPALRDLDRTLAETDEHQQPHDAHTATLHGHLGDVRVDDTTGLVVVCCHPRWPYRWKVIGNDPRMFIGGWRTTTEVGHFRYIGNLLHQRHLVDDGQPPVPARRVDRAFVNEVADAAVVATAPATAQITDRPESHAKIWHPMPVFEAGKWARNAAIEAAEVVLRAHGIQITDVAQ
jgi:hypothetical protein